MDTERGTFGNLRTTGSDQISNVTWPIYETTFESLFTRLFYYNYGAVYNWRNIDPRQVRSLTELCLEITPWVMRAKENLFNQYQNESKSKAA